MTLPLVCAWQIKNVHVRYSNQWLGQPQCYKVMLCQTNTRLLNSRKRIYEVAFGNASVCCVEAADVAAAAALFPTAAMKKKRRRPRRRSPGNKQARYMQAMHRLHTLRGTHIDCTLKDKHTYRLHMSRSDNREAHTSIAHSNNSV